MFESKQYAIRFTGNLTEYFPIWLKNTCLSIITLGFYRPWAKAIRLRYLFGNTSVDDSNFRFSGNGRELFYGYIKAIGLLVLIAGLAIAVVSGFASVFIPNEMDIIYNPKTDKYEDYSSYFSWGLIVFVGFYVTFFCIPFLILPLGLHGKSKYMTARSSYRGIQFSYTGKRSYLFKWFAIGMGLSVVTFGIAIPYVIVKIIQYVLQHIRFGNLKLKFVGEAGPLILIFLLGTIGFGISSGLLAVISGGAEPINIQSTIIYYLISGMMSILITGIIRAQILKYIINNIAIEQEEKSSILQVDFDNSRFIGVYLVNTLITIVTLGFGSPLASIRTMQFIRNKIQVTGSVDLDEMHQEFAAESADPTANEMLGFFEVDFIF